MKRCAILVFAMAVAVLGLAVPVVRAQERAGELFFVGTRQVTPGAPTADKHGLYAFRLNEKTGALTALGIQAQLDVAQYLAVHPKLPVLYSVARAPGGTTVNSQLHSFAVDRATGALTPNGTSDAGGRDATFVSVDPTGQTAFIANHDGGDVAAIALKPDGGVDKVASRQTNYGTGPLPRQNRPQAHSVLLDPSGKYVVVPDLGADRVFVYGFDRATRTLSPATPPFATAAPGSGPRHLAFHPSGKFVFVDTEMGASLMAFGWGAKQGHLNLLQTTELYPANYNSTEAKSSADIRVSRDGRFVYVSLRGNQDSIVALAVDQKRGTLKEVQRIASGGKSPRGLAIDPSGRWLLVAHDVANTLVVWRIDPRTGKLAPTGETLAIPAPSSIAFAN